MNWALNKTSSLGLYNITKPTPTPIITLITMEEVTGLVGSEKHLCVSLIRYGCKMLNIPFAGGGTIFFPKSENLNQDLEFLKKSLNDQLLSNQEYMVAYEKLDKPHHDLTFYAVIAIRSNDVLDLRKAFKVQKLKAFI